jgi:hypothetical protein
VALLGESQLSESCRDQAQTAEETSEVKRSPPH